FTPTGIRRWTYSRYQTKVAQIAQVAANAGGWQRMDVIGLCEVEDSVCVADICRALGKDYRGIHYDSRDARGIDVALIYRTACTLLSSRAIQVSLPDGKTTRDLLYAQMVMPEQDTVDFLLCHLPSMRGGYGYAAAQRKEVIATMQYTVDSLLLVDSTRQIIVMGDMNDAPRNDLQGVHNMMCDIQGKNYSAKGTYKYHGVWTYLDQCYLSEHLYHRQPTISVFAPDYLLEDDERYLSVRPKRTYIGFRYIGGYSDHLPIVLQIKKKKD
ncbi:MAG: endonuclease, partial [Paludibacteraceae bacterium]